jgi:hypothetical protein
MMSIAPLEENLMQDIIKQFTASDIANAAPTLGQIVAYTGENIPVGWLPCDHRMLLRDVRPELFRVIGTQYGDGDGSNTAFNLPLILSSQANFQYIIFVSKANTWS